MHHLNLITRSIIFENFLIILMSVASFSFAHLGVSDLISWSTAKVRSTYGNHRYLRKVYGLAILISTDYEVAQNKRLLDQLQPASTIAIVHNSDFKDMSSLLNLSNNLTLVTLSPHVADSLSKVTGKAVEWLLPVSFCFFC
jgi:hypothetical protein